MKKNEIYLVMIASEAGRSLLSVSDMVTGDATEKTVPYCDAPGDAAGMVSGFRHKDPEAWRPSMAIERYRDEAKALFARHGCTDVRFLISSDWPGGELMFFVRRDQAQKIGLDVDLEEELVQVLGLRVEIRREVDMAAPHLEGTALL